VRRKITKNHDGRGGKKRRRSGQVSPYYFAFLFRLPPEKGGGEKTHIKEGKKKGKGRKEESTPTGSSSLDHTASSLVKICHDGEKKREAGKKKRRRKRGEKRPPRLHFVLQPARPEKGGREKEKRPAVLSLTHSFLPRRSGEKR